MEMPEDFFAAMEEAYNNGEIPRELMFAYESNKIMKTCHGDLCILKDMLKTLNPEADPTINDLILFKNLLSTIIMQACLMSGSAEELKQKYPDILD